MIFTAFLLLVEEGWIDCAMDGNGRSPRDEGKDEFRRGTMRCVVVWVCAEEELPARGEETMGRDMVVARDG